MVGKDIWLSGKNVLLVREDDSWVGGNFELVWEAVGLVFENVRLRDWLFGWFSRMSGRIGRMSEGLKRLSRRLGRWCG